MSTFKNGLNYIVLLQTKIPTILVLDCAIQSRMSSDRN